MQWRWISARMGLSQIDRSKFHYLVRQPSWSKISLWFLWYYRESHLYTTDSITVQPSTCTGLVLVVLDLQVIVRAAKRCSLTRPHHTRDTESRSCGGRRRVRGSARSRMWSLPKMTAEVCCQVLFLILYWWRLHTLLLLCVIETRLPCPERSKNHFLGSRNITKVPRDHPKMILGKIKVFDFWFFSCFFPSFFSPKTVSHLLELPKEPP